MYFISEVLSDSKTRYSQIQKLLYAVLITKRKLRHYFESERTLMSPRRPRGGVNRPVKIQLETLLEQRAALPAL